MPPSMATVIEACISSSHHKRMMPNIEGAAKSKQKPHTEMNRVVVAQKAGMRPHVILTEREDESRRKEGSKKEEKSYLQKCLVCWEKSDLLAIASCMHPVCLKCTIRMRVLGNSKECPVCRSNMEMVSIVQAPKHRKDFCVPEKAVSCEAVEERGIRFSSSKGLAAYERCLANRCVLCQEKKKMDIVFPSFELLRRHLEHVHKHSFCLICVENVNSLVMDRPVYDKMQLEEHMRVKMPVDPSNDSSKGGFNGHPVCRFCHERKYDDEQLYRHLKHDHFACAICETDGGNFIFHRNAQDLMKHYRRSHYPCAEEECATAGIVFRTELELMLHKSKEHTVGGRPMELASQMGFRFANRNDWRSARAPPQDGNRAQEANEGEGGIVESDEGLGQLQIIPSAQQASGATSMHSRSRVGLSGDAWASPQVSRESVLSGDGASQVTTTTIRGGYADAFPNLGSSRPDNNTLPSRPAQSSLSTSKWNLAARQTQRTVWPVPSAPSQPPQPIQPSGPLEDEQFPSLSTQQKSAPTPASSSGSVWGSGRTSELLTKSGASARVKQQKVTKKPDYKPKSEKPEGKRDLVWR